MIIARSPLRISLGGGGTDLPSYSRRFGGSLIAAAIDKYVYITVHRTFVDELIVKYSRLERVKRADQLQHPILREALRLAGLDGTYLEITSMADIPAGTGLGSSGSFTTATLRALAALTNRVLSPRQLAEQAAHIEIDLLGEAAGKQDPYIAAFGGVTRFDFLPEGTVEVAPLGLRQETLFNLEDNLVLFFTGYSRDASSILRDQDDRTRRDDREMIESLHEIRDLGRRSREALEAGDLREFAAVMRAHWESKRRRSPGISNRDIDAWYELGMQNGALGGKVIGAGGGGFLMFYAEDKTRLRRAMGRPGLPELRFRFDFQGTRVVAQ